MSNGLYRLDAFGLQNVWNMWRLQRGALDEPELESQTKRHELFADDFYDRESLRIAQRAFPNIHVRPFNRTEWR